MSGLAHALAFLRSRLADDISIPGASFCGFLFGCFLLGMAADLFARWLLCRPPRRAAGAPAATPTAPPVRPTAAMDPQKLAELRAEAARSEPEEAATLPSDWVPMHLDDEEIARARAAEEERRAERAESQTVSVPRPAAGSKSEGGAR